jgi:hypothetical protein
MEMDAQDIRSLRAIKYCVYCGETHDLQRDHVIPTSYLREKRRYEGDWLVTCCGECNRTLGNELICNVPDRAYYLMRVYERKYNKLLKAIPWCDEEIADMGYALRQAIIAQESARKEVRQRIEHLRVTAAQPISYLAQLRPTIDPEDEDVAEFIDDDMYNRREVRSIIMGRSKRRYTGGEID